MNATMNATIHQFTPKGAPTIDALLAAETKLRLDLSEFIGRAGYEARLKLRQLARDVAEQIDQSERRDTAYVSYSISATLEVKELGEDCVALEAADALLKAFDAALDHLRARAASPDTRRKAHDFYQTLSEARHETSWASHLAEARDAYVQANVRPIATR